MGLHRVHIVPYACIKYIKYSLVSVAGLADVNLVWFQTTDRFSGDLSHKISYHANGKKKLL